MQSRGHDHVMTEFYLKYLNTHLKCSQTKSCSDVLHVYSNDSSTDVLDASDHLHSLDHFRGTCHALIMMVHEAAVSLFFH